MSIDSNAMLLLIQRQDKERKVFAASVYKAWQAHKDAEAILLTPYDGNYKEAAKNIKELVDKARAEYWTEWGTDGTLETLMKERHEQQRRSLMTRYQILDGIRQSQQRNKDKDHER